MGSTLSAPWAYLQKHGWPWMGIPASLEIFRSWSVKLLQRNAVNEQLNRGLAPALPTRPNSLEQVLPTLFLWGEAGHGPDLDLDAGVELLPSHVPHALVGRGHGFVLRRESLRS